MANIIHWQGLASGWTQWRDAENAWVIRLEKEQPKWRQRSGDASTRWINKAQPLNMREAEPTP
ncbi:hypothetical protein HHJ39_00110 [Escherichia coli]|nr:hypothetical protein HHJ39_00110 [Escherichia coli]